MALTLDDLKAIRKVVQEEVKVEVRDSARNLEDQIRLTKISLSNDLSELDDRMKNVEIRMDNVVENVKKTGKDVKDVRNKVNKIEKTTSIIAKNYDEGDAVLHRRLKKVEKHLGLPQN